MYKQKVKIMVVEDEIVVAREIKEKLQAYDYDVPAVLRSGEEVLGAVLEYAPDLILMDIKLKGRKNGIATSRLINKQLQIPIVFLTAYGDKDTLLNAKRTNPYGYIIKPFQDQELIATIEMALNRFTIEKKLEENRNYLSTVLSSIADGVITTDVKGIITFINPVAEKLTGWKYADALGKNIISVFHIVQKMFFNPVEDPVKKMLRSKEIVMLPDNTILIAENGEKIHVETSGAPIKDKTGKIIGVVLVFRDINEKIKSEEEKKRLEEHLRQAEKMEAIGQLSAGIAHDFNNQLTGIQMFAELIKDMSRHLVIKEYITKILTLVNRSTNLTKQLLAFSQKGKYQIIHVDIHNIIREVIAILRRSIDKRIKLKLQLYKEPAFIACDPSLIQNAIFNLALNARDAITGNGTIIFTTEIVRLEETDMLIRNFGITPGNYIKLCVVDNGKGMDESTIKHIFEPFFTTKANGKGTGMGLAAVYGTVKNHKGAINVASNRGEGSRFELYLPVSPIPAQTKTVEKKTAVENLPAHILYIDDEEMLRISVKFQLENKGFKVSVFQSGEKAILEYQNKWKSFNVVLLDMIMPHINGKDTFIQMKAINPEIKAIILSGYYTDEEIQECIKLGVKGFLKKPFTRDELIDKIRSIL